MVRFRKNIKQRCTETQGGTRDGTGGAGRHRNRLRCHRLVEGRSSPGPTDSCATNVFTFAVNGETLTGTVTSSMAPEPAPIENGTIKGDEIAFGVTRQFDGNEIKLRYTGTVSGDEESLTAERLGGRAGLRVPDDGQAGEEGPRRTRYIMLAVLTVAMTATSSRAQPVSTLDERTAGTLSRARWRSEGVPEQDCPRAELPGRREGAGCADTGVLRLLRLAFVGAWPLAAGAPGPRVSEGALRCRCRRRTQGEPHARRASPARWPT